MIPTPEIIIAVAERLKPDYLPASTTVERWRSTYLSWFDREIAGWNVAPDFVSARRAVIDGTFGRLLNIVRARADDAVSLEEVRAALAKTPGSLTEEFIAEREER